MRQVAGLQQTVAKPENKTLLADIATAGQNYKQRIDGFVQSYAVVDAATKSLGGSGARIVGLTDEIIRSQAQNRQDEARFVSILSLTVSGLALVVGLFFAVTSTRTIIRGVAQAIRVAEDVAVGDVSQDVTVDRSDEIGKLLTALGRMIRAEREAAGVASSLAAGDLTVSVAPRSDKDALLTSMFFVSLAIVTVLSRIPFVRQTVGYGARRRAKRSTTAA